MKRNASRSSGGFTLIELLIVIIVIAILAAIAIPMYLGQRNKAKDAAVKEGIHSIAVGVASYAGDHNDVYPASGSLNTYLSGPYVDRWPKDPFNNVDMRSSSAIGGYTYTSTADSFTLVGHLSNGSDFTVASSGPSAASSATSFTGVSADLIALQRAFFAQHGYWPRSWAPFCYTDLGLDPAEYAAAIGNVIYKPVGSRLQARPSPGYVMTVTNAQGQTLVLTNQLNWNLVYDATTGVWYYRAISPENRIDISTLTVNPG